MCDVSRASKPAVMKPYWVAGKCNYPRERQADSQLLVRLMSSETGQIHSLNSTERRSHKLCWFMAFSILNLLKWITVVCWHLDCNVFGNRRFFVETKQEVGSVLSRGWARCGKLGRCLPQRPGCKLWLCFLIHSHVVVLAMSISSTVTWFWMNLFG